MTPQPQADGSWLVDVDPAWPGFAGHFPGNPLVPGAEQIAWAMAVAAAAGHPATVIAKARFVTALRPGERARLTSSSTRNGLRVRIASDEAMVAEVVFSPLMRDA